MRRKRLRLAGFDYLNPGAYFVTICAKDRMHLFGEISDGVMHVNQIGEIVQECWCDLQKHYTTVELDAFVLIPNHVHGIVAIVDPVGGCLISHVCHFEGAMRLRNPNKKNDFSLRSK